MENRKAFGNEDLPVIYKRAVQRAKDGQKESEEFLKWLESEDGRDSFYRWYKYVLFSEEGRLDLNPADIPLFFPDTEPRVDPKKFAVGVLEGNLFSQGELPLYRGDSGKNPHDVPDSIWKEAFNDLGGKYVRLGAQYMVAGGEPVPAEYMEEILGNLTVAEIREIVAGLKAYPELIDETDLPKYYDKKGKTYNVPVLVRWMMRHPNAPATKILMQEMDDLLKAKVAAGIVKLQPKTERPQYGKEYSQEGKLVDVSIDTAIVDLVDALNKAGYRTFQSCSGIFAEHPGCTFEEGEISVFGYISFSPSLSDKQKGEIKQASSTAGIEFKHGKIPGVVTVYIPKVSKGLAKTDINFPLSETWSDKKIRAAWARFGQALFGYHPATIPSNENEWVEYFERFYHRQPKGNELEMFKKRVEISEKREVPMAPGGKYPAYVQILSPGETDLLPGSIVSWEALQKANNRVKSIGESPARWTFAPIGAQRTEDDGGSRLRGEDIPPMAPATKQSKWSKDTPKYIPDSPEWLAETIQSTGWKEKLNEAFQAAIDRIKGK